MEQGKIDTYLSRLDEVFSEMVRRLHVELANQMVEGITGSQFFVLKNIEARGRMTVSEVAGELGVSLSAITSLVDRLVKAGLAARVRDGQDRRIVWLEATEAGREIVARCIEGRRRVAHKYLGQLPPEDTEKLIEIYEKILVLMRAEEKGE